MSQFNRKESTTVKAQTADGSVKHFAVRQNSKLARITRHKNKQMAKAQKQHIKSYKQQLKEAKKKFPIEQRAHLKIEDL